MNNDQEEIIMYRNHENKHKIRSPPNKFIIENNYEHSPEKFSLSDNGTSMEIDSFRNCLKLEKEKHLIDMINEDTPENENGKTNFSSNKKNFTKYKNFDKIINREINTLDTSKIKIKEISNENKIFLPPEFETINENEESDK